jgi:hypothetical protein
MYSGILMARFYGDDGAPGFASRIPAMLAKLLERLAFLQISSGTFPSRRMVAGDVRPREGSPYSCGSLKYDYPVGRVWLTENHLLAEFMPSR